MFGRKKKLTVDVTSEETPTGGRRSVATAVCDLPVEPLFRAATDYERYTEFMPRTVEGRVVSREGDVVLFRTALDFVVRKVAYTLRLVLDPPAGRVTWTLVEGDVTRNEGSWQFDDLGDGRTRVTYTTWVEIDLAVPKRVLNKLVAASLPDVIERTVARARGFPRGG